MQVNYNYSNSLDGFFKIWQGEKAGVVQKIRGLYSGMGFYGLAYVLYIAMEFSLFESLLHEIETRNLFGKFTFRKKKHPEDIDEL